MSNAADIVRAVLTGRLGTHEAVVQAMDALDALVAERDRWRAVACNVKDGTQAAEAEVARLREALMPFVDKTRNLTNFDLARAVAALGEDA